MKICGSARVNCFVVQKVRAEICNEIETIIGTANTSEQAAHE